MQQSATYCKYALNKHSLFLYLRWSYLVVRLKITEMPNCLFIIRTNLFTLQCVKIYGITIYQNHGALTGSDFFNYFINSIKSLFPYCPFFVLNTSFESQLRHHAYRDSLSLFVYINYLTEDVEVTHSRGCHKISINILFAWAANYRTGSTRLQLSSYYCFSLGLTFSSNQLDWIFRILAVYDYSTHPEHFMFKKLKPAASEKSI